MPAVNASEKAKEKAELGTRIASRLSLSAGTKKDAKEFRFEPTPKIMGLFVFDIKSITKRLFFTMFVFYIFALVYFIIETTLYFSLDRLTLRTYPYFMNKYYLCCINTSHRYTDCVDELIVKVANAPVRR